MSHKSERMEAHWKCCPPGTFCCPTGAPGHWPQARPPEPLVHYNLQKDRHCETHLVHSTVGGHQSGPNIPESKAYSERKGPHPGASAVRGRVIG